LALGIGAVVPSIHLALDRQNLTLCQVQLMCIQRLHLIQCLWTIIIVLVRSIALLTPTLVVPYNDIPYNAEHLAVQQVHMLLHIAEVAQVVVVVVVEELLRTC
jgi:hypothetical protein